MTTTPGSEPKGPDFAGAEQLNLNLNLLADAFSTVAKNPTWSREHSLTTYALFCGHTLGGQPFDRDSLENALDNFCKKIRDSARIVWHDCQKHGG